MRVLRDTVECRYNAVQFITILQTAVRWQQHNVNQISNSQQTPHTSPSRASYGVSIMRILKKINRAITAPHYMYRYMDLHLILSHNKHYTNQPLVCGSAHYISLVIPSTVNASVPRQNGPILADDILKCIFWMKITEFRFKFHWNLFPGVQLKISQHWFRWWSGAITWPNADPHHCRVQRFGCPPCVL